jgi:hypothetical protein
VVGAAESRYLVRVDPNSWQVTKIEALPGSMGTDVGVLWGNSGGPLLETTFGTTVGAGGTLPYKLSDPRDTTYFVDPDTMVLTPIKGYKPIGGGSIVATAQYAFYLADDQRLARFDPRTGETTFLKVPLNEGAKISALKVIP